MLSKKFISAGSEYNEYDRHVPAPLFRKSFILNDGYRNAEIAICGLGFYRLFVNGTEITKGHIAPYISNPDDILYYDRYEVGKQLKTGENCIGIMLGNGMLNAVGGYTWDFDKAVFRGAPKLALTFSSENLTFEADESFVTAPSPITFDDLRSGEFYDARLEQADWSLPGFDQSAWKNAITVEAPRGRMVICEAEPIVVREILKPVSITPVKNGFLYDFGVNTAGVCRLHIEGSAGHEIIMLHGETLDAGELSLDNIISGRFYPPDYAQCIHYITKDGKCDYTPSFTYFGFRYVEVRGVTAEQADHNLLEYLVMSSDLKERGGFVCSDETANKLQEITRRSTLSNFFYFPTDCPHREKNGWTGDASLSAEHTLLNLQAENSYSIWLDNIRAAQDERGALPGIVPTTGWGFEWGNGPVWDSALVNLPYFAYIYRGNRKILEDNATAIFRYLNYITTRQDARGLIAIGLGDWCPAGRASDDYKSPLVVTDSITVLDICRKAAYIFDVLGMNLQKKFAEEMAQNLKSAVRKHLIDLSSMTVSGACQTSQAMGIFYDVFEPGEKAEALDVLMEFVRQSDNHLDVGIVGARVIFHVLSMFGESDLAYEIITRPDFPSYGYWLKKGATTLFEAFQKIDGGVEDLKGSKVSSLNHHMFGDISAWFIKRIAGIMLNPHGNDINEVNICPSFVGKLDFAEAFHIAPSGEIRSKWERKGNEIILQVIVPENMTGRVVLPSGYYFDDATAEKNIKASISTTLRILSIFSG